MKFADGVVDGEAKDGASAGSRGDTPGEVVAVYGCFAQVDDCEGWVGIVADLPGPDGESHGGEEYQNDKWQW